MDLTPETIMEIATSARCTTKQQFKTLKSELKSDKQSDLNYFKLIKLQIATDPVAVQQMILSLIAQQGCWNVNPRPVYYGLHKLFEAGRPDLTAECFLAMQITSENVPNLEIGILLIQYLISRTGVCSSQRFNLMQEGCFIIDRLVSLNDIRKRPVELLLNFFYSIGETGYVIQLINKYLLSGQFGLEAQDIIPLLPTYVGLFKSIVRQATKQEVKLIFDIANPEQYGLACIPPPYLSPEQVSVCALNTYPLLDQIFRTITAKTKNPDTLSYFVESEDGFKPTHVIDGANLLFNQGQNRPSVEFLAQMVQQLSSEKIVVVLHIRHINGNILPERLLRSWKSNPNIRLVTTPYGINDDYYSIGIAMAQNCYLVTNDKFRDHINTEHGQLLAEWSAQKVTTYQYPTMQLTYPCQYRKTVYEGPGDYPDNLLYLPTSNNACWLAI
jgi:hypothetical protein